VSLVLRLEEKFPDFARRYQKAGEAWDVALQLAALRKKAGLYQLSKMPDTVWQIELVALHGTSFNFR